MERRSDDMASTSNVLHSAAILLSLLIILSSSASATLGHNLVSTIPHDGSAFTQGLEMQDGRMFESTGLHGHSQVREISLEDGSLIRSHDLNDSFFGEGVTLIDDRILVLTWKAGLILEFERDTFNQSTQYNLEGEGWGMCSFGDRIIVSDGTNQLSTLDPLTLEPTGSIQVRSNNSDIWNLNELECVEDKIYANQWMSPFIHVISANDGELIATLDLSDLPSGTSGDRNEVLNGIAWDVERQGFWVTGKNWTTMHLIELYETGQNEDPQDTGGTLLDSMVSEKNLLLISLAILATFAVAVSLNQPPPSLSAYNEDE